jgi:anti-sigma regulatory factor (Ser/Thr protein kinase)/plasmid stability protein
LEGHRPPEVVAQLNRLLGHLRPSTMTTAVYLAFDPERESVTLVNAGHPPPLMIGPDGTARYLPVAADMALGVSRGARYREQRFDVPSGSTLLLYTDGVIEVRGENLDDGLERLRLVAERHGGGTESLCDAVLAAMFGDAEPADDVALLALCLVPLADRLTSSWPARADSLAGVRHLLRRWLREHGASDEEVYDITVATQEACANAVEHAYSPGEAAFDVDATQSGRTIEVTVRDRGRWRRARGSHRGRGLPMMEALMDSVHVQHAEDGTVVVLRRDLRDGGRA